MSKGKLILLLFLIALVGGAYWIFSSGKKKNTVQYKLEQVERGDVTSTVTATGPLSAVPKGQPTRPHRSATLRVSPSVV